MSRTPGAIVHNRNITLAFATVLTFALACTATAQDNETRSPSARQQLQSIHTPQSIDQELDRLTKDLALTPEQRQQIRPLLQEHHDKIQAVLDKNPSASR